MIEEWRELPDLVGYRLSNLGSVWSCRYSRPVRTRVSKSGYHTLHTYKDNKFNKAYRVHRLIAKAFIPNPQDKPYINHKDGNKLNNTVANLEWCTPKENSRHAYDMGLLPKMKPRRRELGNGSKLKEWQVTEIRRLKFEGSNNVAISKMFGVHHSTIARIVNRVTWTEELS